MSEVCGKHGWRAADGHPCPACAPQGGSEGHYGGLYGAPLPLVPCPDCARLERRVVHLETVLSALRVALGDE